MKKIAYLLKMFPRFAETFILNEILELERQGVNLHIYSLKRPNESFRQGKLNLVHSKVTYVPEPIAISPQLWIRNLSSMIPIFRENLRLFLRTPNRYLRAWHVCYKFEDKRVRKRFLAAGYIAQSLLKNGIEHLHAHFANDPATVAHLVYLLSGIPYSFTAHAKDIYLSPREDLQHKIHLARFVTTCTKYNQKYLQEIATNGTPIYTIYHGLDEQMFFQSPEKFNPSGGYSPLILSVGRLVEKKGFDTLIRACGLLRDWQVSFRCEIVGEGPMAKYLKGIIAQLQLNKKIEVLPFLPQERLVKKYLQAAVFALPCQITRKSHA